MAVFKDIAPHDPLLEMKEKVNREHSDRLEEIGRRWDEHPEERKDFLSEIRERNREAAIEGWLDEWWDLDENFEPISLPHIIKASDLPLNALMAHVLHQAGIFKSVGEAKKNGWNKPIEFGDLMVTKRKIRIRVVE